MSGAPSSCWDLDPRLCHDPEPFECPYSSCEYDCQKRAPVRVPCVCRRIVCRKCAGVAGAQPSGCGLCGTSGVEFRQQDCARDLGLIVAMVEKQSTESQRFVGRHFSNGPLPPLLGSVLDDASPSLLPSTRVQVVCACVCDVQCAMCSVRCAVCSVQCAVCCVQCAVCSVRRVCVCVDLGAGAKAWARSGNLPVMLPTLPRNQHLL
jgi:hypothetical protein